MQKLFRRGALFAVWAVILGSLACGGDEPRGEAFVPPSALAGKADGSSYRWVDLDLSCGSRIEGRFSGWDSAHLFPLDVEGTRFLKVTFEADYDASRGSGVALYARSDASLVDHQSAQGQNAAILTRDGASGAYYLGVYALTTGTYGSYRFSVQCRQEPTAPQPQPEPEPEPSASDTTINGVPISFVDAQRGAEILSTRDAYFLSTSPFDRAFLTQTEGDVSLDAFASWLGDQALSWTAEEKARLARIVAAIDKSMQGYNLPFPAQVELIKGTDAMLSHTRGAAVYISPEAWGKDDALLQQILTHELFHVISRANADWRNAIFALIDFRECAPLKKPSELVEIWMTNPDPTGTYCITLSYQNGWQSQQYAFTPILYGKGAFTLDMGKDPMQAANFKMLAVEENDDVTLPLYWGGKDLFVADVSQVPSFFQSVGMNTQYIVHPEEIMADNFSYLFTGKTGLQSPQLITQLSDVLQSY